VPIEYNSRMASICKLFTLLAVLVMPFGMSSVHATAVNSAPVAGMPMGHCPDQPGKHNSSGGGIAECMMACAAALPAAEPMSDDVLALIAQLETPAFVHALRGLAPEIATPPPKRA